MMRNNYSTLVQKIYNAKNPAFSPEQFARICSVNIQKISKEKSQEKNSLKDTFVFVMILQRYIPKLEKDLVSHENKDSDHFKKITEQKLAIMKKAVSKLGEGGTKEALAYLEGNDQQQILSQHRDPIWLKYATFGTIYLLRMIKAMLGYPSTDAEIQISIFRTNSDEFKPNTKKPGHSRNSDE